MGTGLRSQSLRGPRPSYGKLQEPWGRPLEGRLRRALSLRQGHEKSMSSNRGPESLDAPHQERLPGDLGDKEQLIQAQQEGSRRWLRQYQQKSGDQDPLSGSCWLLPPASGLQETG
ncbi:hypothetical protein CB1_000429009 [Camelus ferus]|nr:hypothetical protein CB1_000429009 [Camelus ferus]